MPSRKARSLSISNTISGLLLTKSDFKLTIPSILASVKNFFRSSEFLVRSLKSSPTISILTGFGVGGPLCSLLTTISAPGISQLMDCNPCKYLVVDSPSRFSNSTNAIAIFPLLGYEF